MEYAAALIASTDLPGWTLPQLLRHVGRGDRWAAQIIADRADVTLDPPGPGRQAARRRPGRSGGLPKAPGPCWRRGPDAPVSTFLGPKPACGRPTRS